MEVLYIRLTVVAIETSPDKLVVVCDLVDDCTETADTVLDDLRRRQQRNTRFKSNLFAQSSGFTATLY